MLPKVRLDRLLVKWGWARSRSQAQSLLKEGAVRSTSRSQLKASDEFDDTENPPTHLSLIGDSSIKYVSRGGLKLEGALETTCLQIADLSVLDIGISTGGFADCLLQRGAKLVVGLDVGHDQLAPSLRNHPNLTLFEGVNARHLTREMLMPFAPDAGFDLCVVDVSFISLAHIVPQIPPILTPSGYVLALVKPQFEVGAEHLNKNGIVKNSQLYVDLERKMRELFEKSHFQILSYFKSSLEGGDGNTEFFIFGRLSTR